MKKVVATAFPDPLLTGALAFGKAVRAARTTSGMTQADAALVIGISKQTLLDIESGTGTVGLALSLRTAHELGVSLFAVPTEQPPTEVGGFTRVAGDWKSTHYAPRVGNAASSQIACSSKPKEAARLKLTGWKPVALTL